MFQRLKNKWNVSWGRFTLIFITFALGGSACARVGSWLLSMILSEKNAVYWIIYVPLISILWPLCVLTISIPLGQFPFFWNYLKRMGKKIAGKSVESTKSAESSKNPAEKRIAIFASGAGSNAKKIIEYFMTSPLTPLQKERGTVKVALIVCNNPKAGVLNIAAENNIPVVMVNRKGFYEDRFCLDELQLHKADLLVLAGFLWKIPSYLIDAYRGKIINIHPALLPGYGGKGMYGEHVHRAVIAAGEKESGITIHYVDEHYDNGDIIFQEKCPVLPDDSAASLAQRIHVLEHAHYPKVIEKLLR